LQTRKHYYIAEPEKCKQVSQLRAKGAFPFIGTLGTWLKLSRQLVLGAKSVVSCGRIHLLKYSPVKV